MLGVRIPDVQDGEWQMLPWGQLNEQNVGIVILPFGEKPGRKQISALAEQRRKCGQAGVELGLYVKLPMGKWQSREDFWLMLIRFLKSPEWRQGETGKQCRVLLDVMDPDEVYRMDRVRLGQGLRRYLNDLRECGVYPVIYGNKYWQTAFFDFDLPEGCCRWVAQYHRDCTYSGDYEAWEYTSAARMTGIRGLVSLIRYKPEWYPGNAYSGELPDLSGYVGTSVVGALNRVGYPADFKSRGRLAVQTGCCKRDMDYKGTAEQNKSLLKQLGGTVSQSRILREGTYVRILPEARETYSGRRFEERIYNNTFQILAVSGASLTFGIGRAVIGTTCRNAVAVVL